MKYGAKCVLVCLSGRALGQDEAQDAQGYEKPGESALRWRAATISQRCGRRRWISKKWKRHVVLFRSRTAGVKQASRGKGHVRIVIAAQGVAGRLAGALTLAGQGHSVQASLDDPGLAWDRPLWVDQCDAHAPKLARVGTGEIQVMCS